MILFVQRDVLTQRCRYNGIAKLSIKLTVSLVVVGIIGSLILNIVNTIPSSFFVISALAQAGIGFVAILILLHFGTQISVAVRRTFDSRPELFTIAYSLVHLLVVLIAYAAFRNVFNLFIALPDWAYSLAFLGIGTIPGIKIATTIINSIDNWIDHPARQEI